MFSTVGRRRGAEIGMCLRDCNTRTNCLGFGPVHELTVRFSMVHYQKYPLLRFLMGWGVALVLPAWFLSEHWVRR